MPTLSTSPNRFSLRGRSLAALLVLVALVGAAGYFFLRDRSGPPPPDPASKDYRAGIAAFYIGLSSLQSGDLSPRAPKNLALATKLLPEEPATWANLGLYQLRQKDLVEAAKNLEKARTLAPDNAQIEALLGLLASSDGKFADAITHLRRAAELDPSNLKTRWALKDAMEQQKDPDSDAQVQRVLQEILKLQPDNLAALVEAARVAAKSGDDEVLREMLNRIEKLSPSWPVEGKAAREQLQVLKKVSAKADAVGAAQATSILGNVLKPLAEYQQSRTAVESPAGTEGEPIERFLVLPPAPPGIAPPDKALTFAATPLAVIGGTSSEKWSVARAVWLNSEGAPIVFAANGRLVRRADAATGKAATDKAATGKSPTGNASIALPFPGGAAAAPPALPNLQPLDWSYDFLTDLVLSGAGGLRLFQQGSGGSFRDVTALTTLPAAVTTASYWGAWPADIESDGDLDIVLGSRSGPPLVLRNNRDGNWTESDLSTSSTRQSKQRVDTFAVIQPFKNVIGLRAFAWGDVDGDGDADAALLDATGKLHVFTNERSGNFTARAVPSGVGQIAALTVAEVNDDNTLDIVALQTDGAIVRVTDKLEGRDWDTAGLTRWTDAPAALQDMAGTDAARILVADLDNNGGLDIVASAGTSTRAWLRNEEGKWEALAAPLDAGIHSVADLNGDGRLDLTGVDAQERAVQLLNGGKLPYHWQIIRPRAGVTLQNDQRVNSFGIGGELEVRAGLLHQKQPITGPVVHFGLGEQTAADVWRIQWPNGAAQFQAEFDQSNAQGAVEPLKADRKLAANQRLQTSCPFLFAWDGKEMKFVTDCIWRSPLGLKINAQDTLGVMQTEDWIKIRGDQLKPRDGFYDLRITAELWETHFFDHVSLMAVDHPAGMDIWVDERLAVPQPPLQVYGTAPPRPVTRAWDEKKRDVTGILRARDGRYLGSFERGEYQGMARDHWVEVELGDEVPRDKPLFLMANGWIRPTNSSINVALAQGRHDKPRGLSLEVPDGRGGWKVARPGLGFPEGKVKTVLISLDGVFAPDAAKGPRRFRLRTNLEIFWDSMAWAENLPQAPLQKQRINAQSVTLGYRGFSVLRAKDITSPEMPQSYDDLETKAPRWRDLTGYYTRFGDVRELLGKVDDRYVIMNAGDEMRFRFKAPPPPRQGWVRDFVMIGDGWVKDGDFNTTFSKTVLPLPAHDLKDYDKLPRRLQDDPVYRRHARDWRTYHTRYVTPRRFRDALRPHMLRPSRDVLQISPAGKNKG